MKIVCISDTHNLHDLISMPDGDVLVHAGDATMMGSYEEVSSFAFWMKSLPYEHKILVPGNHDWLFEDNLSTARSILGSEVVCLKDESTEIGGIKFYGSPWQPWFYDWAFNMPPGDATFAIKLWDKIPDDTNVLIVHGPPAVGNLDRTLEGIRTGCPYLTSRITNLPNLKLGVFGHIHEGYGRMDFPQMTLVNASICNRSYKPVNAPIVVEV